MTVAEKNLTEVVVLENRADQIGLKVKTLITRKQVIIYLYNFPLCLLKLIEWIVYD